MPGLRVWFTSRPFAAGLLVARQHIVGAFPRREKIEIAEFLREPHRLIDDALEFVVVTHFDKAGEREILAQRMTLETVVGEDAPHIGMAGEDDAVKIVSLALEPLGARKNIDDRWHRGVFVGRRLDSNAQVKL